MSAPVLGASIFPADTATDVIAGVTGAITDNIAVVIGLVVFFVGLAVAQRMLGGALKGKVRVR